MRPSIRRSLLQAMLATQHPAVLAGLLSNPLLLTTLAQWLQQAEADAQWTLLRLLLQVLGALPQSSLTARNSSGGVQASVKRLEGCRHAGVAAAAKQLREHWQRLLSGEQAAAQPSQQLPPKQPQAVPSGRQPPGAVGPGQAAAPAAAGGKPALVPAKRQGGGGPPGAVSEQTSARIQTAAPTTQADEQPLAKKAKLFYSNPRAEFMSGQQLEQQPAASPKLPFSVARPAWPAQQKQKQQQPVAGLAAARPGPAAVAALPAPKRPLATSTAATAPASGTAAVVPAQGAALGPAKPASAAAAAGALVPAAAKVVGAAETSREKSDPWGKVVVEGPPFAPDVPAAAQAAPTAAGKAQGAAAAPAPPAAEQAGAAPPAPPAAAAPPAAQLAPVAAAAAAVAPLAVQPAPAQPAPKAPGEASEVAAYEAHKRRLEQLRPARQEEARRAGQQARARLAGLRPTLAAWRAPLANLTAAAVSEPAALGEDSTETRCLEQARAGTQAVRYASRALVPASPAEPTKPEPPDAGAPPSAVPFLPTSQAERQQQNSRMWQRGIRLAQYVTEPGSPAPAPPTSTAAPPADPSGPPVAAPPAKQFFFECC